MFGVIRRSVTSSSRGFDRQRVLEGHLLRSLRSDATNTTSTRSYFNQNGAHAISVQRIIEGAVGSTSSSSSSSEDRDGKRELSGERSLHTSQNSLHRNFRFDKSATSFRDPLLAGIRMPVSALSLDVLRPSADLMTSTSSPFSPRTSLRDPLQTALGVGWQGGPHASLSISHRPAKRYFSSEQSSPNSQYKTSAKIPTPKSAPNTSMFSLANFDPQALLKRVLSATWSITKIVLTFLVKLPMNMFFYLTHPKERREKIQEIKGHAQKEFDHYWTGSKVSRKREHRSDRILSLIRCYVHSLIHSFVCLFVSFSWPMSEQHAIL